jgi:hypothetical protein
MRLSFFALWLFSMNHEQKKPTIDFIKNKEYPVCAQCCHFLSTDELWKVSPYSKQATCRLFGEKDVVTGVIDYKYATSCRSFDTLCGLDGKHFIKKD